MKRAAHVAAVAAGAVAIVTVGAVPGGAATPKKWQSVKAANARYQSFERAQDAGYTTEGEPCISVGSSSPPPGFSAALGIRAVNPRLVEERALRPLRPEILLYAPGAGGKLRLVGVEYVAVALARTEAGPRPWFDGKKPPPNGFVSSSPAVLGRALDGPTPGQNRSMPWHYDLRVWLWAKNPAGMFAPFNPALSC